MKWKFADIDKPPELSPDLEWMLQSGQVSRQLLLETLVEKFYSPVSRLVLSLTNDATAAQNVLREIFSYLVLNPHQYRKHNRIEVWVYQNAYRICSRALRGERFWRGVEWWASSPGQFTNLLATEPPTELDRSLWKGVDALEERIRVPLVLQYANDWEIPFIAQVTGLSEREVDGQIEAGIKGLKYQAAYSERNFDSQLRNSLHTRWGYPDRSEIPQFIERVNRKTGRRHSLRSGTTTVRELMLLGLAILIVLLVIWGGNRYILGEELLPLGFGSADSTSQQLISNTPPPEQQSQAVTTPEIQEPTQGSQALPAAQTLTPTPTGVFYSVGQGESLASIAGELGVSEDELRLFNRLPAEADLRGGQRLVIPGSIPTSGPLRVTPVAPIQHSAALPAPKTSDDVFDLLNPDEFHFNTLWFSAEILTHEPQNPNAASSISTIQVWLSPRQFLLIGGRLGEEPQEVSIGMRGRLYVARPGSDQPWFQRVHSRFADPFIDPSLLSGLYMLFGEIDELTRSEFVAMGDSLSAGRDSWVVSQLDSGGDRIGLLYLDQETGFILRYRKLADPEISQESGDVLPDEVIVKSISYDVDFPQELFDLSLPWRGGYAADHTGRPGSAYPPESEPSTLSYNTQDRQTDLPEGLDLSSARLSFRFPIGLYKYISMAGTEIYVDDYYLGRVDMGIPWSSTCQRSPDGKVLVYRTMSSDKDDLTSLSYGPYYLALSRPLEIRRILPGARRVASDFAISPDSRYVAIWACERNDEPCGVYLHDIHNHRWQRLIDIQDGAADLMWSPEGDQLALRTAEDVVWVVSVEDGELLYTSQNDVSDQSPPPGNPIDEWGFRFPPRASGLEACINPPGDW